MRKGSGKRDTEADPDEPPRAHLEVGLGQVWDGGGAGWQQRDLKGNELLRWKELRLFIT